MISVFAFGSLQVHRLVDVGCLLGILSLVIHVAQIARRRLKTTALRGPPSPSLLWGVDKALLTSPNPGAQYETWAEEYGGVYQVPTALGGTRIVLCDPKAIAHVYGGEPWTYVLTPFVKMATENLVGNGILTAIGKSHQRQRKTLTPAFSNAAIRDLTPVFYDSVYKVKAAWDSLIASNDHSVVIDVQTWMSHISLDTIGIAGFSHEFGALDGKPASVTDVFDALGQMGMDVNMWLVVLAMQLPWLLKLPTPARKLTDKLNEAMGTIANELLTKSRQEREAGTLGEREENSILGLLLKAENKDNGRCLTREEVMGQAKVLLVAGFETISISLTWALIELSKNPSIQTKLRAELVAFGADPTYDHLSHDLPYLDGVVHETLRMHAPLTDFTRMATHDDVIPLSTPVRTRTGERVDRITVAQGTYTSISVPAIHLARTVWGPDAKRFDPERWYTPEGIPASARAIQGHRHLLTFLDGPRTCLGKGFAIAQFKMVLAVLVKRFTFELVDGPGTVIETARGILPRPKVAGEQGSAVPLRVRRFE